MEGQNATVFKELHSRAIQEEEGKTNKSHKRTKLPFKYEWVTKVFLHFKTSISECKSKCFRAGRTLEIIWLQSLIFQMRVSVFTSQGHMACQGLSCPQTSNFSVSRVQCWIFCSINILFSCFSICISYCLKKKRGE